MTEFAVGLAKSTPKKDQKGAKNSRKKPLKSFSRFPEQSIFRGTSCFIQFAFQTQQSCSSGIFALLEDSYSMVSPLTRPDVFMCSLSK